MAVITLQENNALALVTLGDTPSISGIKPLGFKDWSEAGGTAGIDASDRDAGINIRNWPVFGMYQPDTIESFVADGQTYYITANEGDASEVEVELNGDDELIFTEEERIKDLVLDPIAFPNAAELQEDENLGRLLITTTLGDADQNGSFEELYTYGARSFSIWDANGDLLWDSGSIIEETIAELFPADFNTDNDENDFDGRSDAKGPEPEAVTTGVIDGVLHAFVGLERVGGVMIFDLSDPTNPSFVTYLTGRNLGGDPEDGSGGDLGPESLNFISSTDSPTGTPLLLVANEISGTISVYSFRSEATQLQLLHASDLEGGSVGSLDRAENFAAIIEGLRAEADPSTTDTLTVSAGDNYLPGPIFGAAGDRSLRDTIRAVTDNPSAREGAGRADIAIMNAIGFDASALGNHEFDAGTTIIEDNIGTDVRSDGADPRWLGAEFPYLSANLDFSGDPNISGLFTSALLRNDEFVSSIGATPEETLEGASRPKLAPSAIVRRDGQTYGIIGATTQRLSLISSVGGVLGKAGFIEDMALLAEAIQPEINEVIANGVDKIILVSHLQDIALEKQLIGLLNGVDIIVAGGSDTLQASSGDRLNAGDVAIEDYPFLTTNADGDTAIIVSTDGEYSYVGRLVVDFDQDGHIVQVDDTASRPFPTDEAGVVEAGWESFEAAFAEGTAGEKVKLLIEGDSDPELAGLVDVINTKDGNVFGNTTVFLEGRRERVRTQETNLGNLTARANLWVAQQAEAGVCVSLKNGGGIRAAIGQIDGETGIPMPPPANPFATPAKEAGQISQLDIENSLRFNNGLALQTVTAQQLLEILEHGVAATGPGSTPGQFPQVAGLRFVFDASRTPITFARDENGLVTGVEEAGERVRFAAIVDEATGAVKDIIAAGGQVVGDPSRPIRMVTLDFLAGVSFAPSGGDGYPMAGYLAQDPIFANRRDLRDILSATGLAEFAPAGSEQDAFAEYLLSVFGLVPFTTPDSELDRRIVIGEDLTDQDGDGLAATSERALGQSDNNANPFAAAALASVQANSQAYGLFTEDNIQDLRGDGLLIQAGESDVTITLPLEINSSLDPDSWSEAGSLSTTLPRDADKAFYRVNLGE